MGSRKSWRISLRRYVEANNSPQLPCDVVVVDGGRDVGLEIVRTARERLVDLIVMGSRRVAALFGPNAEQVFRTASCPVLVIHPQDGREPKDQFGFSRILVAHDSQAEPSWRFRTPSRSPGRSVPNCICCMCFLSRRKMNRRLRERVSGHKCVPPCTYSFGGFCSRRRA